MFPGRAMCLRDFECFVHVRRSKTVCATSSSKVLSMEHNAVEKC